MRLDALQLRFHGITAVAELKGVPRAQRPRLGAPRRFHGITAVAELKEPECNTSPDGDGSFHGITAVAELKGDRFRRTIAALIWFPRHHSRGRIEGWHGYTRESSPARRFHGITAVAELKDEPQSGVL